LKETITMQFSRATSTAALFLLIGAIVPVCAQGGRQDERQGNQDEKQGKPEKRQSRQQRDAQPSAQQQRQQRDQGIQQQQQRRQQSQQQEQVQSQQQRPQQQQGQRSQQARQQQQSRRTQQQATAWQQQRGWVGQGGWQGNNTWQQGRARQGDREHRTWAQRGGYGGYYIPQSRFIANFGSQHWFRMRNRPTMYMGYPRFSYGGFSFLLVDPWPEYWEENWYAADDVYIDYDNYDDGYYLYNRRQPSVRLAITVVL
jgi:hypothetical protein